MSNRLIGRAEVKAKGVPFSDEHNRRLIKQRVFPAPVKLGLGDARCMRCLWVETEIDAWIAARITARDAEVAA
jgi:predicted DNA-binding transcriptional regulator AlpA